MNEKEKHWDGMYAMPLSDIPWEIPEPPTELISFLKKGSVTKGDALDVGCGTGNYSFYLAQQGFKEVTGVDFSHNALTIAEERNKLLNLPVRFIHADATKLTSVLGKKTFDFIFDYSLLHHIAPEDVAEYAKQFTALLKPGGKLLLMCYSDKDVEGTTVTGKYGNDMFYRTRQDIQELYSGLKEIEYKEGRLGKRLHHIAHYFVFEK